MSPAALDIEHEPEWLELPLESPSRRDDRDRRQVVIPEDPGEPDEPRAGVIVIELV